MIFIYISSNSIQHEFFIYLICRTVIKTPEVLIFLYISKMSFRLNGTCLAFQDPAFTLDIGMRSFFQFLPLFIDLHDFVLFGIFLRIILMQTARFMFTSAAVCTTIYLKGLCISILFFALCPEMPQFTSVMADIELFIFKDPCPHEAYYSLSPKKRKIVDMQQRGYIDEDGQIDEDAIYDDACEAAEELAVFLRAVFNNPKEDSKKLIKFLDNLWTAGKYKQLQATLIGFELLFEFPEKYLEDVECCLGEARKSYLSAVIGFTQNMLDMTAEQKEQE